MGIRVECPHGHVLNVKEKYAGKKGLCPKCPGQVFIHVPDVVDSIETNKALQDVVKTDQQRSVRNKLSSSASGGSGSIFDEGSSALDASSSGSLLSGSVIRHNTRCACGASVPMWYAKCPSCGVFLEH